MEIAQPCDYHLASSAAVKHLFLFVSDGLPNIHLKQKYSKEKFTEGVLINFYY